MGGSAWKFSSARNEYYLAQMGPPDLNFRENAVIEEFNKVIQKWAKAGASGLRLSNVYRLLVDQEFRNEDVGSNIPPHTHDEYEFYTHKYTRNQEDINLVLAKWRQVLLNSTNNEGILTLLEDVDSMTPYVQNDTVLVDIPRHTEVFNFKKHNTSATHLFKGVQSTFAVLGAKAWPSWKVRFNDRNVRSKM